MPRCKYYEYGSKCIYDSDDQIGDGFCILHSKYTQKDRGIFKKTISDHRKIVGEVFTGFVFPPFFRFEPAYFSDNADFRRAHLSADFQNAQFGGNVDFEYAECDFIDFGKASFFGEAHFGNAKFDWSVNFASTKFKNGANFYNVTFNGRADFFFSEFGDSTGFQNAEFTGAASFWQAKFSKFAYFSNATFSGKTDFRQAKFGGEANFSDAKFSGEADFRRAEFNQNATFRDSRFLNRTLFVSGKNKFIIFSILYFSIVYH